MKTKSFYFLMTFLSVLFIFTSCNSSTDNQEKQQDQQIEGDWEGCVVGFYTFDIDGREFPDNAQERIDTLSEMIDHEIGSIAWFPTWADPFPAEECKIIQEMGAIPHLTWELFWPDSTTYNTMNVGENGYDAMDEVLAGEHDEYIETYAKETKEYGGTILMRFMHEFNGNWYVWSGNKNGAENGGPEKVVAVWKYVVDKFNEAGAENVKWVWVPHGPSTDLSTEPWNNISNYWPGEEYVDWVGLDAYNFYPVDPWGGKRPFRDFDNCFRAIYDTVTAMTDKPVMIAEFGTGEFEYEGKTKADWIKDAFYKIEHEYPKIKLFTYFHIKKELDWRVNSSPEALEAYREAMQAPYYIGNPYKNK